MKKTDKNFLTKDKKKFNLFKAFKKSKLKIAAFIMAIVTLIPTVPAFALNVADKSKINRKWFSDVHYQYESYYGDLALLSLASTGEPVYCLEPRESISLSKDATATDFAQTSTWRNLNDTQQTLVTLASIYGYDGSTASRYGYSADTAHAATLMIIWDAVLGYRTGFSHGICSWVDKCSTDVKNCYNRILDEMNSHSSVVPVFDKRNVTLNGTGQSNAVTITDTAGVLNQFTVSSSNGNIGVSKSGNQIKVWANTSGNFTGSINVTKVKGCESTALALIGADQTVLYGKIYDPITRSIPIRIQAMKCNLSVAKQDSETNAILDGAKFKVQEWSYDSNGYHDYKNLAESTYNGSRRYTATDLQYTEDNGGWFRIIEVNAPTGYDNSPVFYPSGSYTSTAPGEFRLTEDMNGKTFNYTVKNALQYISYE